MDEYLGLPEDAPQRFGVWLSRLCLTGFRSLRFISSPQETTRRGRQTGMHKNLMRLPSILSAWVSASTG
jgi:hypothetical protein